MANDYRKTKTSSAVKRKYNSKVYSTVRAELPKDLVTIFKEKCAAEGVSQASIIKSSIENFING